MPELTVIYWRDIPAQVTATDGEASARVQLPDRFQKAIDAAAMKAGLSAMDDYLAEWRRVERSCGPDIDAEVGQEAELLADRYPPTRLRELIRNGGLAGGT